ncbi:hypothetical protein VTO42DRAFT_1853 [Malbranchea cinnamomea]
MVRSNAQGASNEPAFQVIVLGASGGPLEDTVTGLLVRSTATKWCHGSIVAVDAGTLMAGIRRTLECSASVEKKEGDFALEITEGPFSGLMLPNKTTQSNAAYIFREMIGAVLITHPHLDHVAGLAMNTPAIEAQYGPKTVAALPSAVAALKNHVFNDILWPNLSDEDGGAGLITYQRLVDGGNPRLGRGEGRGYVKVCEGLMTKCLSVSHGACNKRYNPETGRHHRAESSVFTPEQFAIPAQRGSVDGRESRRASQSLTSSTNPIPLATVESSAFFIRDEHSGAEIIVFGDVEPDSLSLEPRNSKVWEVAAPKIAAGTLRAIFIECSFSDSVDDASLYGHLCPRHLIAELVVLASNVVDCLKPRRGQGMRKRKRQVSTTGVEHMEPVSPKTSSKRVQQAHDSSKEEGDIGPSGERRLPHPRFACEEDTTQESLLASSIPNRQENPLGEEGDGSPGLSTDGSDLSSLPLAGFRVYIIHVKESLCDEANPRDKILQELRAHSEQAGLGCEFYAPQCGQWAFV